MDPENILKKYYSAESRTYNILLNHSRMVTEKALKIARHMKHLRPEVPFIYEAAMLHDIGIFLTMAPEIGCYGKYPYVCHGFLGRELLEREGFPKHALVCERHVGMGLTVKDIKQKKFPVPMRDMVPVTIEEQIICYADKFFSKVSDSIINERPLHSIRMKIAEYGTEKLERFDEWVEKFQI